MELNYKTGTYLREKSMLSISHDILWSPHVKFHILISPWHSHGYETGTAILHDRPFFFSNEEKCFCLL